MLPCIWALGTAATCTQAVKIARANLHALILLSFCQGLKEPLDLNLDDLEARAGGQLEVRTPKKL